MIDQKELIGTLDAIADADETETAELVRRGRAVWPEGRVMSGPFDELIGKIKAAEPQPIPADFGDVGKMIGVAHERAKRVLIGSPKETELTPVWCVLTATGHAAIVATPFLGEDSKEAVAGVMRQLMSEVGAVRYTLASEAWLARVTPEQHALDKRPPSERDDRLEVVMIMGADRAGSAMMTYEIIRDWTSGQITDLKPLDEPGETMPVSGRFANLLEDA